MPTGGKSVEDIVGMYAQRRTERGSFFEQCRRISAAYNNEIVLPVPEQALRETPAVANLISSGIDQHAMRIASVLPDVQSPPVKIGDRASETRADKRKRASIGWWEINAYNLLMRRRARWLIAYAQSPVRIHPDFEGKQPKWQLRTPLETYPGAMEPTDVQPKDCIFAVQRTVGWLRQHYPDVDVSQIRVNQGKFVGNRPLQADDPIELITFEDENETVMLITGQGETDDLIHEAEYGIQGAVIINLGPAGGNGPRQWAAVLKRLPNRAGQCTVVIPGRISLSKLMGQFDSSIGLFEMQAKLAAMEFSAIANSIWPDLWMVSQNGNGQIITPANGRKGVVGNISNATLVPTQIQPGAQVPQAIDRIERATRLNASVPADFSGESASNVRTAVRGNAILGEAVDYTIQEHQEILALSARTELDIAVAIDMAYFRNTKKSFYVSWKGGKGRLDYTPKDIWSEDRTLRVSYAKAGADVNALNVEVGQLVGIGIMSKLTGARMHPDIVDPDYEHDQVIFEGLEQAALSSVQTQASQGALPAVDLARMMQRIRTDQTSLADAIVEQQAEAQERQASTVTPADPGSPDAQPGLSAPGAGAEAGGPIAPPTPSAANLVDLLRGLRTGGQIAAQGPP